MNNKLLIFGAGLLAETVHYYFDIDSDYDVVAFVVDDDVYEGGDFRDKPIISFSRMLNEYPPDNYDVFIAIGYTELNSNRERVFGQCKKLGYHMPSYVSDKATIYDTLVVGENCLILEDVTIQPFATVGDDVIIWNGSHVCHHAFVDDHCFIASHVIISGGARVGKNCFVGMQSAIRDFITIGNHCLIGANSWINKDVEEYGFYSNKGSQRMKELE